MNSILFDDYLIEYVDSNDKKYLSGAINVLIKCGFDEKTITELINIEIEIIKYRREIKKPIIDCYYWIGNILSNERVFNRNINDYLLLRYDTPNAVLSEYTLTLSELCAIFDEAWNVCKIFDNIASNVVLDECYSISKSESIDSWVIREFKTRIEEMYRTANNIDAEYDKFLAEEAIDNLYKRELSILLKKRKYNKLKI